jgi:hypothetical protein
VPAEGRKAPKQLRSWPPASQARLGSLCRVRMSGASRNSMPASRKRMRSESPEQCSTPVHGSRETVFDQAYHANRENTSSPSPAPNPLFPCPLPSQSPPSSLIFSTTPSMQQLTQMHRYMGTKGHTMHAESPNRTVSSSQTNTLTCLCCAPFPAVAREQAAKSLPRCGRTMSCVMSTSSSKESSQNPCPRNLQPRLHTSHSHPASALVPLPSTSRNPHAHSPLPSADFPHTRWSLRQALPTFGPCSRNLSWRAGPRRSSSTKSLRMDSRCVNSNTNSRTWQVVHAIGCEEGGQMLMQEGFRV